ncbi:MAG: response regulator [Planctomycetota bacterium]
MTNTIGKRVLDVGNCGPDHQAITQLLNSLFSDIEIARSDTQGQTLQMLRENSFDLVLINRKLDIDYSDGIEILKAIKADADFASTPVMLITNYDEHQQAAVQAGALHGFGKLEFQMSETKEKLEAVLA